MQSLLRSAFTQASLIGSSRRVLPMLSKMPVRHFADLQVKPKEEQAVDLDQQNKRLGVDTVFNE